VIEPSVAVETVEPPIETVACQTGVAKIVENDGVGVAAAAEAQPVDLAS
jgi:hypothetical protein